MKLLSTRKVNQRVEAATKALIIGGTYFLSSFYDQDGAFVKVLAASTKQNSAGWNSSVTVEVIEPVGDDQKKPWYAPGTQHSVNATNLYLTREAASYLAKRR